MQYLKGDYREAHASSRIAKEAALIDMNMVDILEGLRGEMSSALELDQIGRAHV